MDEEAAAVVNLDRSPDGQTLATANADATVTLWPLTGGSPQTLRGHQAIVLAVDFSADGEQLASSSMDGTVRLWSLDGTLKETLTAWQAIGQVAFHPQRSLLAFGTKQGDVQVVQPTGEVVHTLTTGGGLMPYLTWSPGGDRLAAGGEDQAVYLWDPATGSLRQTLSGHTDTIRTLAFNGDGTLLATGGNDHTVNLWQPATGERLYTWQGHTDSVTAIAIAPTVPPELGQGTLIASGGADKTIQLWTATGEPLAKLERHTALIGGLAFSADGAELFSSASDGLVLQWHLHPLLTTDPLTYACGWIADYQHHNTQLSPSPQALCAD